MTECNQKSVQFSSLKSKKTTADFNGGSLTSNIVAVLLRETDKKLGLIDIPKQQFEQLNQKQQILGEFQYAVVTWNCERRIFVKAEHLKQGANTRFVITNLTDRLQYLYDEVYCHLRDCLWFLYFAGTTSFWPADRIRPVKAGFRMI